MTLNSKNFQTKDATQANILLDYYLGCQKTHLVKMLDGLWENQSGKREEWREKGIVPRTRNITKSIIDKSGLLFNDRPTLMVRTGETTVQVDPTLNQLLESSSWLEFFQTVDAFTRLLKSTVVLTQRYIPNETTTVGGEYRYNAFNGEGLRLLCMHPGNCVIETDPLDNVIEFAYLIDVPDELKDPHNKDAWAYRHMTASTITDVLVQQTHTKENKETIISTVENPDAICPVTVFYDTAKSYQRMFPHIPEDLAELQAMYNISLSDTEFSIAWAKNSTLFTDRKIESTDGKPVSNITPDDTAYSDANYLKTSQANSKGEKSLGGLGSIVQMEPDPDGKAPYIDFKAPNVQLQPLNSIIEEIVKAVASDFSVNLRNASTAQASSGFALIVESMDNLNLREQRAHFFCAGLKHMHKILKVLYPELIQGELEVTFAKPALPINKTEQQQLWQQKISSGLASRKDYFIQVENMTEAQAMAKITEIDSLASSPQVSLSTVEKTDDSADDENANAKDENE